MLIFCKNKKHVKLHIEWKRDQDFISSFAKSQTEFVAIEAIKSPQSGNTKEIQRKYCWQHNEFSISLYINQGKHISRISLHERIDESQTKLREIWQQANHT